MKIPFEQHNVKYTIEDVCDTATITEVVDHMYGLLLNAGYSPDIVADAFFDKCAEFDEGAPSYEPAPLEVDEEEVKSSFEDEAFLRRHSKIISSRYGAPRYFYPLEDDELIYQFFDRKGASIDGPSNNPKSIEPSGGPFILVKKTNLYRDICPNLPDAFVESIKYDKSLGAYRIKLKPNT